MAAFCVVAFVILSPFRRHVDPLGKAVQDAFLLSLSERQLYISAMVDNMVVE
jgi:hypothetical protein